MKSNAKANIEAEIKRITDLPIIKGLTEEEVALVSRHYLSPEAYARGDRLREEQAQAMVQYHDYGGVFCTLGVGGGKTLISFMIANEEYKRIIRQRQAGNLEQEARGLLVVQANLLKKFENDAAFMRSFLKEIPPYYILQGSNKRKRTMLAKSGQRGLYVCSYHTLSSKDASDILDCIRPAFIIEDEAQNVAGTKDSARAKRFRNYVNEYQPNNYPLSGTMTRKSVMEYFFLAKSCLGKNNFLPNSNHMAEEWAAILDSSAPCMSRFQNSNVPRPGPISHVVDWCAENFDDVELPPNLVGFRRAFAKRMTTAPGVICSTTKDPVGSALIFNNNPCDGKESRPGWDTLQEHLQVLTEDFETPSGEILTCAMNIWGYRYQMEATGFYYDLYWRTPEELADARRIGIAEATSILERSKEHHEKHKSYQSALRRWLAENSRPHLDTPALIGNNMYNYGDRYVGKYLYEAWSSWKGSAFDGLDVRQQNPVRVCDFKIRSMVEDVVRNKRHGGLIWYQHNEMGQWAMDALRAAGLDPVHCPRGDWANTFLNDPKKYKGEIVVLTGNAHAEGKDLQHGQHRNYHLQMPMAANKLEQMLGRTHRPGQKKDEVESTFYLSTDFDIAHFNGILNDTAYMQQSTTQNQKLLIGSYTFKPRSVPYTALQEMGGRFMKPGEDGQRILDGILER
jgi:hypothetical protein